MKKMPVLMSVCLAAVVACAGCAAAQSGALVRAQASIDKGKYESALKRLSEAEVLKDPTEPVQAQISYLRAVCYAGLNKPDEAKAMYRFVADRYPDTGFGYMAKEKLSSMGVKK